MDKWICRCYLSYLPYKMRPFCLIEMLRRLWGKAYVPHLNFKETDDKVLTHNDLSELAIPNAFSLARQHTTIAMLSVIDQYTNTAIWKQFKYWNFISAQHEKIIVISKDGATLICSSNEDMYTKWEFDRL